MNKNETGFKFVENEEFFACMLNGMCNSRIRKSDLVDSDINSAIDSFKERKRNELKSFGHLEIR